MALTPTVAVIWVASGKTASLLGVNDVVAVANEEPEAVTVELGDSDAVKPEDGYAGLVKVKVIGTPGWLVLSVAVTVTGAEPATNCVGFPVTLVIAVPDASVYTDHVGPGYDAGEEPPSIIVVVNVAVGGAAVAGDSTLDVIVPSVTVSVKPGPIPVLVPVIVKVSAAAVAIDSLLR